MSNTSSLPKWQELMQPVLDALKSLGGSGSQPEVVQQVAADLKLTDEQLDEVTPKTQRSRFSNRVAWARFYLTTSGHVDSGTRGLWLITEKGREAQLTGDEIKEILKTARKQPVGEVDPDDDSDDPDARGYVTRTLEIIKNISPAGFEQLSKRLLRESGFQKVTVTGGSGDGGIDGFGVLKVNDFMSFQVYFQCKRYKGIVGSSVIRDFRGAMMGRADKGIILTTGRFTTSAEHEAVRDGVPPIELVNGEDFVQLLGKYELGLKPITTFELEESFFDDFKEL